MLCILYKSVNYYLTHDFDVSGYANSWNIWIFQNDRFRDNFIFSGQMLVYSVLFNIIHVIISPWKRRESIMNWIFLLEFNIKTFSYRNWWMERHRVKRAIVSLAYRILSDFEKYWLKKIKTQANSITVSHRKTTLIQGFGLVLK